MNVSNFAKQACKLSHKQFRALLKKFRRKRIRQQTAQERDYQELLELKKRENSPSFIEQEEDRRRNSQLYEEFEERERLRKHKEWLWREEIAQNQFRKKQQQLELEKIRREEERKRILEEFEKQQNLENKLELENKKMKNQKEEALQEALASLPEDKGPFHNPIAPKHYTNDNSGHRDGGQEQPQCQFFAKTGACRFGERCSRGHIHPSVSTTILIKGMFTHYSIDHTGREDHDTDMALEYDDKETYEDFKNFYVDVLPEFKKYGKVVQFKVCCNHEPHLRGNVYIQYSNEKEAVECFKNFNGRYYAGKQLTCEFTHVIKWRSAICGLYFRKACPKGINCNFLHVFKNPSNEFWEADRDLSPREFESHSHSRRSHNSRYNSERYSSQRSYSRDFKHHQDDYNRDHYRSHSSRVSESDSDEDDRNYSVSSRSHYRDKNESSHHKSKHRDSRSRSRTPKRNSSKSENSNSSKKHKHKKKKKKSKKWSSNESEDS
ncbi:U2 small nuclear ribonucleoprotein auxiliary factor 35 kDa subunit-related protein 2-like [Parasteatoda tepidariorum]|uniref:U2 small nuclear ribonucleoprotein auxiliary factor 35 kDa subunit-related protein 2-like n=1 Tax=Parasteatoda tepidariorum TaxID=114398 RepID=UPI001C723C25|nr:U2 small nuclear ribonucleoprotein auxiliary factor 35 kDa subunit-related protein 1 [Parasteatoda tepidariorum]